MPPEKPPLGIVPRSIWEANRITDIRAAILRMVEAGWPIPVEWVTEYNDLLSRTNENTP